MRRLQRLAVPGYGQPRNKVHADSEVRLRHINGMAKRRKTHHNVAGSGNKHIGKTIKSVYLLGYGKLKAVQDAEGLHITLPKTANNIAPVVR